MHFRSWLPGLILLLLPLLHSCEKQDPFDDRFSFMYGEWTAVETWSISVSPENIFDILKFAQPDEYSLIIESAIADEGNIRIGVQNDTVLNLVFISTVSADNFHHIPGFHNTDMTVSIYSPDSIGIRNNLTDYGFFSATLIR